MEEIELRERHMYRIRWYNNYTYQGWYKLEEALTLTQGADTTSVGYFIAEVGEYIIITTTYRVVDDIEEYKDPLWIPKGCIESIEELKDENE